MSLTEKHITEDLPEFPQICELMETAFSEADQTPMEDLLSICETNSDANYRAFYHNGEFCGILYTVEASKFVFILYIAVPSEMRSKGYGSQILQWLKNEIQKMIILNVDIPYQSAEDRVQREKRISFYSKNGITDTGYETVDLNNEDFERLAVLTSDVHNFNCQEYIDCLKIVFPQSEPALYEKKVSTEIPTRAL